MARRRDAGCGLSSGVDVSRTDRIRFLPGRGSDAGGVFCADAKGYGGMMGEAKA